MPQTTLHYPLDLGDGDIIWCRDAHQASLLRGIWVAWVGTSGTSPPREQEAGENGEASSTQRQPDKR